MRGTGDGIGGGVEVEGRRVGGCGRGSEQERKEREERERRLQLIIGLVAACALYSLCGCRAGWKDEGRRQREGLAGDDLTEAEIAKILADGEAEDRRVAEGARAFEEGER